MMRKNFWMIFALILFIGSFSMKTFAEIPSPIYPDGISVLKCDVAWNKDLDDQGDAIEESLRHRIELYNRPGDQNFCQRTIFFLFKDQTIPIEKPLVLEKNLHDRGNGIFTGTYISGYGTQGEKLNITIDALKITEHSSQCAFVVKGGFSSKQQIKGITLKVATASQAICDEYGNDLLHSLSPHCPGKIGGECDFNDITVLVADPMTRDEDRDGVNDEKDRCPGTLLDPAVGVDEQGCPLKNNSDPQDNSSKDSQTESSGQPIQNTTGGEASVGSSGCQLNPANPTSSLFEIILLLPILCSWLYLRLCSFRFRS